MSKSYSRGNTEETALLCIVADAAPTQRRRPAPNLLGCWIARAVSAGQHAQRSSPHRIDRRAPGDVIH